MTRSAESAIRRDVARRRTESNVAPHRPGALACATPMERIVEPELMDTADQAEAYAIADFADVNQAFVDRLRSRFPDFVRGEVVDLGCGPADIPIRLCNALSDVRITAVDGSRSMLEHAARAIIRLGLRDRIELVIGRLPGCLPPDRRFDAVISNSLL